MQTVVIQGEKAIRQRQFSIVRGERSDSGMFHDLLEVVENTILLYDIIAIVPTFSRQPIDHLEANDILVFSVTYLTYV